MNRREITCPFFTAQFAHTHTHEVDKGRSQCAQYQVLNSVRRQQGRPTNNDAIATRCTTRDETEKSICRHFGRKQSLEHIPSFV